MAHNHGKKRTGIIDQDIPGITCTFLEARPVIDLPVLGGQDPRPDIPGPPSSRSAYTRNWLQVGRPETEEV